MVLDFGALFLILNNDSLRRHRKVPVCGVSDCGRFGSALLAVC